MSNAHSAPRRPIVPRLIRVLSIPIIVFWVLVAVGLGLLSPSLDAVADKHSVSLAPQNSPAFHGMMNIGHVFKQFDSDSTAMVVLEGQDKLGDSAHGVYNQIVTKLHADRGHVENVQDFWSDPLTAAGSQSPDGKAAYVQVFLVGAQGTGPSKKSVAAVRNIVASVPSPPGVKAYVAGNTVLNADVSVAGHKSLQLMAVVSIGVILAMLLIVYRSVVTAILALLIVGIELFAAQGITATAGNLNIIGLTPYAVSMVTMLTIAAGTDYVIFLLGRYQEARSAGQDRVERIFAVLTRRPGFLISAQQEDHVIGSRGDGQHRDHAHRVRRQTDDVQVARGGRDALRRKEFDTNNHQRQHRGHDRAVDDQQHHQDDADRDHRHQLEALVPRDADVGIQHGVAGHVGLHPRRRRH